MDMVALFNEFKSAKNKDKRKAKNVENGKTKTKTKPNYF